MDYWSSGAEEDEDIAEWLGQSYDQTAVGAAVAEVVGLPSTDGEQAG